MSGFFEFLLFSKIQKLWLKINSSLRETKLKLFSYTKSKRFSVMNKHFKDLNLPVLCVEKAFLVMFKACSTISLYVHLESRAMR